MGAPAPRSQLAAYGSREQQMYGSQVPLYGSQVPLYGSKPTGPDGPASLSVAGGCGVDRRRCECRQTVP